MSSETEQQVALNQIKNLEEVTQLHALSSAEKDNKLDRALRKHYAYGMICILALQLLVLNVIFVCVGRGSLKYSDLTIQIFMTGTLAEIFGVVLVITRYLFSRKHATL